MRGNVMLSTILIVVLILLLIGGGVEWLYWCYAGRARRAIGWVPAVLALVLMSSLVLGWSAGGRLQAGEKEGQSGPSGRDPGRRASEGRGCLRRAPRVLTW